MNQSNQRAPTQEGLALAFPLALACDDTNPLRRLNQLVNTATTVTQVMSEGK